MTQTKACKNKMLRNHRLMPVYPITTLYVGHVSLPLLLCCVRRNGGVVSQTHCEGRCGCKRIKYSTPKAKG